MGTVETKDPLKALRGAGQGERLLDRLLRSRREDREREERLDKPDSLEPSCPPGEPPPM